MGKKNDVLVAVLLVACFGCAPLGLLPDAGGIDAGDPDGGSLELDGGLSDAGSLPDAGTSPDSGFSPLLDAGVDITLVIDTAAQTRAISRYIYGKNFSGSTWATQSHLTLYRLGGNRWTAYNWETNASNAGSDYMFHNDGYLGGGNVAGEAVRAPVAAAQTDGAATLVTIPIAGWVAADKLGTSVTGQPITSRFKQDIARKPNAFIYPPNVNDSVVYQDEFVSWLENTFPEAHKTTEKEIFYSLDNEPDLWSATHFAIHPNPVTYVELVAQNVEFAGMVKRVEPKAKVFGPASYGFGGYLDLQGAADANGRDFLEFYLDEMKKASTSAGHRLLDVLDLHWYPEARGGGIRITGEDTGQAVVAARLQAPRSLWDETYVETSWIADSLGNKAIQLVPRLKQKIQAKYPQTELAFTEYYFGAGAHISGALAQADVLGIFGREGVYAATLWPMTSKLQFIDAAFQMFRNFDGSGAHFGDTSVLAETSKLAQVTVYASTDSSQENRVVAVAINKTDSSKSTLVTVAHSAALTKGQVYQLTAASAAPVRTADIASVQPNNFIVELPAMSVSTLVLAP